jgi:hypothetical protein
MKIFARAFAFTAGMTVVMVIRIRRWRMVVVAAAETADAYS